MTPTKVNNEILEWTRWFLRGSPALPFQALLTDSPPCLLITLPLPPLSLLLHT